jgi:hypothetical protein
LSVVKDGAPGTLEANRLVIKDPDGDTECAGINGMSDSDVLFWAGGTFEEADYAANHSYYINADMEDKIPTLIKYSGDSKIGVLEISGEDAIISKSNSGLSCKTVEDLVNDQVEKYVLWSGDIHTSDNNVCSLFKEDLADG